MNRARLNPMSLKLKGLLSEYKKLRAHFMMARAGDPCPVMLNIFNKIQEVTDIHHLDGREGELLNDVSRWMAVSREGHFWIHENPKAARKNGWLK